MSTPTTATDRSRRVSVGERVELGRYRVSSCERVLYGQRIAGVVRVSDHPATDGGRCYLVERELEQDGPGAYAALKALVADYLDQAQLLDRIPMAGSVVRHYIEQLVAP